MRRRFNILFAFTAILFSSCIADEDVFVGINTPSSKGGIHIVGAVEDYDIKSVGTRADNEIEDSYISEMTMFIFKSNGDLVQGYSDLGRTVECSSAINIQRGNPTFLVDTEEGILADLSGTSETNLVYYNNEAEDLGACKIYIVANVWHQLKGKLNNIKSLSDLEGQIYEADNSLSMPMIDESHHRGFPMIGTHLTGSFKLKKGADNEGNAVATIPLKKLYSKVNFTMQVNANQVVAGQTPKFTISKVEVFNVPKKARLGRTIDSNGKPVYGTSSDDDYVTEMGISGTYEPADWYYFPSTAENQAFVIEDFNKKTIYHSTSATTDDVIQFGFYMPEHKVMPNAITYPANIDEEFKQYYKPAGVGQSRNGDGTTSSAKIATFVRIHGSYTDHNGQILGVKYDIYLGQNNTDDFTVKRNQLLNNKLIITGLTNHKDAYPDVEGNISIDHRVEIEDKGFNLSMERTAILDSHFEVRPLDIELSPKSQMEITIPEAYRAWIAMENDEAARSGVNTNLYANTVTARKGVRKYFTNDLVTELNGTGSGDVTITLSNNASDANTTKSFRIWFYIDENPNVYDKTGAPKNTNEGGDYKVNKEQYRVCPVKFKFTGTDKDGNTLVKDATINFQQWNLWRVWSADGNRYYDIEHEEEYLNNYASDVQYGGIQNGMAYGLEGIQLSNNVVAYWKESASGPLGQIINYFFGTEDKANSIFAQSGREPYYDFYLSRDQFPVGKLDDSVDKTNYARNYSGHQFNLEIATTLKSSIDPKAKIDGIILTEDPQSAFAYCYHKNKRNANGVVDELKWFLPAIDEIEDIALGAYDEFDKVFQNQKYWSCQPSYNYNDMTLTGYNWLGSWIGYQSLGTTLKGEFYEDNKDRARATSIYATGVNNYSNIQSGLPSGIKSGKLSVSAYDGGSKDETAETTYTSNNINYNSEIYVKGEYRGNTPRTEKCRIRAVYRSGTK